VLEERDGQRPRRSEAAGGRDLLRREHTRRLDGAELSLGQRRLRTPGDDAGVVGPQDLAREAAGLGALIARG
jgi:hypothetical protein